MNYPPLNRPKVEIPGDDVILSNVDLSSLIKDMALPVISKLSATQDQLNEISTALVTEISSEIYDNISSYMSGISADFDLVSANIKDKVFTLQATLSGLTDQISELTSNIYSGGFIQSALGERPEYTSLQYLESDGSAYINTGLIVKDSNMDAEVKFNQYVAGSNPAWQTNSTYGAIFGGRNSNQK